jgi:hypothetical protein
MSIKYTNIFHCKTKCTQIGIFGLKLYHLATPGSGQLFAPLTLFIQIGVDCDKSSFFSLRSFPAGAGSTELALSVTYNLSGALVKGFDPEGVVPPE